MRCQAPYWIEYIFDYFYQNLISQETVNNAMNWLYEKGIIICNITI